MRPKEDRRPPQNMNFSPSWICRAGVDVDLIVPAVGLRTPPVLKIRKSGIPRFTQLNALNASSRNCIEYLPIFWFLNNERSASLRLGPRSVFRPALPKTPAAGVLNTDGSNHCAAVPV